jgi:hypothetical protein
MSLAFPIKSHPIYCATRTKILLVMNITLKNSTSNHIDLDLLVESVAFIAALVSSALRLSLSISFSEASLSPNISPQQDPTTPQAVSTAQQFSLAEACLAQPGYARAPDNTVP